MASIHLTDEEQRDLLETLERTIADLSVEIADTDRLAFRDRLKQRRDRLRAVVAKLQLEGRAEEGL